MESFVRKQRGQLVKTTFSFSAAPTGAAVLVAHYLREGPRHVLRVPEVAVVLELEEDALDIVVDAAQAVV